MWHTASRPLLWPLTVYTTGRGLACLQKQQAPEVAVCTQHTCNVHHPCCDDPTFQDVPDHVCMARYCAAHSARKSHHGTTAVAQGADAVQGAWDAGPVVAAKLANTGGSGIQLLTRHLSAGSSSSSVIKHCVISLHRVQVAATHAWSPGAAHSRKTAGHPGEYCSTCSCPAYRQGLQSCRAGHQHTITIRQVLGLVHLMLVGK